MKAAVETGLAVQSVVFPEGQFLDMGTPDGLEQLHAFLARNFRE